MMNDHLSKARYSILMILILILVGCRAKTKITPSPTRASTANAIPLLPEQLPTPTPTPAPTPGPTPVVLENGWYIYTDPDGEFSFAYPPTALISAGQNPVDFSKNILIQFQIPEKTYQGMSIRVEPNPGRLQGAQIAKQLYEKSSQKSVTVEFTNALEQMSVGGISAVRAVIPSTNTEVTVIIPYADKVFIVAPVHETSSTKVEQGTLDLFYQILNSMKFGISNTK